MNYSDKLRSSAKWANNIVCMGLDPVVEYLPHPELGTRQRIVSFFTELLTAMKDNSIRVAAFKPNIGYYSKLDRPREGQFEGSKALASVLDLIADLFPEVPVILDSKRGDIATSSANYAFEAFECWKADCVTVSPYMGTDSIMPFVYEGKGMYILNRTSNPGGKDLQNLPSEGDGHLYDSVAKRIEMWATDNPGIGAVVGATSLTELREITSFYAGYDIPVLIPGVGSQGGTAPEVMEILRDVGYELALARINSSSGLTHPWKKNPVPENYIEVCLDKIKALIKEAKIR